MEKQRCFRGKSTAINLAQVMAFERVHAVGIGDVLGYRQRLRVTLLDGSNVVVDGDEVIAAMGFRLGATRHELESGTERQNESRTVHEGF